MKVVCPACNARYRLPDDRVRGKVLKIRCKSCGNIFQVRDPNTKSTDSASIRSRSTRASGAFGAIDDSRKTDSTSSQSLETSTGSFSDERIWYYSINGESYGPYRESELFARFESGRIGSETYVWTEGFEQWKLAAEENRFSDALQQPAEAPPEPEEPAAEETAKAPKASTTAKRKPRDRRASKTMSLDAVQLDEQLQDEKTEEEVASEPKPSESKAAASDKAEDGNSLQDALSSGAFGDEVEDALDQMFGGSDLTSDEPPASTKRAAQTEQASKPTKPEREKSTAGDSVQARSTPAKEEADSGESGGEATDSLASLKSFLAESRKERRRRTSNLDAIAVPDETEETSTSTDVAEKTQDSTPDSAPLSADRSGSEPTAGTKPSKKPVAAPVAPSTQFQAEDTTPAPVETAKAAKKSATTGADERAGDESIDLGDLLAADLTGTGFGAETAAHAAVDDSKPEPERSRKSNLPLVFIILVLLLGIIFVVVELTSDDEPEVDPAAEQQSQEEATVGPADNQDRVLTRSEIRDRRLSMMSAEAAVVEAASEAAKAAFRAVPDEVRNPEAARQAQATAQRTGRTQRSNPSPQAEDTPSRNMDDPGVAFAQPSFGRPDDSGGGPSRQAFANGLNTFVQQSVFQCQQVHMRREGELAIARVAVTIRVNSDGTVSRVSVPSRIAATAFANCLQSQARNWRFSPFRGDSVSIERTYIIQ